MVGILAAAFVKRAVAGSPKQSNYFVSGLTKSGV